MPSDPSHAAVKGEVTAEHRRRAAELARGRESDGDVAADLEELLAEAFAVGEQIGRAHGFPDGWEAGVRLSLAALGRLPDAERERADAAIRAFADRADVVGKVWTD